jgi:PKD domain
MIQSNFSVSPLSGYVLATQFTVTNLTTSDNTIWKYIWDPGTGELVYSTTNPTFTYNYPGTYNISLTSIDYNGNSSVATQQVITDLAYRDYLTFTQIPDSYANPGVPTDTPFGISVISTSINTPLNVDLYTANSLSTPIQFVPEKWKYLTPTSYFTDINSNIVTTLSVVPVPIYVNGVVVAVSGTAQFYYIDSVSTGQPTINSPLLITATLQTNNTSTPYGSNIPGNGSTYSSVYPYPSYANNQTIRAGLLWQVNDLPPALLKVTGNYINNINPLQYNGIQIPTMITYHGNRSYVVPGASNTTSGVLFSYPSTNAIGNLSPLTLTLSGIASNYYSTETSPLYVQQIDPNGAVIGGYVFTSLTSLSSTPNTCITAKTSAYYSNSNNKEAFPYPQGLVPNTQVWVSNPEQNKLNKITLTPYTSSYTNINDFANSNSLIEGYVKQISVPAISNSTTYNYNMSGFSGIYGIAIDPRDYSVVAADAEADILYRFTNTGILTASFSFRSIDNFSDTRTALIRDELIINTPYLSSLPYIIKKIKDTTASKNNYNYLVTLNGVIQPPDTYKIDDNQQFNFTVSDPTPSPNSYVSVTEIFSTSLTSTYISSIQYWTSASNVPASVFPLTGTPMLSANSNYYIVSIDGIMQSPTTYTITPSANTINFSDTVLANLPVQVLYLPYLKNPYTWTYNTPVPTNTISISSNSFYVSDSTKSFLVNVGGVYQGSLNYKVDVVNSQLVFDSTLPINTDIIVTYVDTTQSLNDPFAYTPANVSIDSNYNIWVSLFNDIDIVKFDPNFNVQFLTNPAKFIGFDPSSLDPIDSIKGDYLVKPPTLETDKNNNCWATYSYPLCCLLVKYNSFGVPLTAINLPVDSVPASLAIDNNNNVWVSNSYNATLNTTGNIQLYNGTSYTLMSSITGIPRPGELCLNRNGNLWFTHSVRGLGYLDTKNNNVTLLYNDPSNSARFTLLTSINTAVSDQSFTYTFSWTTSTYTVTGSDLYLYDEDFTGLAVDVHDRLWVIDTPYNTAYVLPSATIESITFNSIINPSNPTSDLSEVTIQQTFNTTINANNNVNVSDPVFKEISILPNSTIGYYVDPNSSATVTTSGNFAYRSAQATGDWTGNKWYQKYTNFNALSVIALSGVSSPFAISNFDNSYQVRRINESFNTAAYYKSLALPENLQANTVLFDQFFPATVGTGYLSANEDMGQITYERIANFVQNHSDVDTCLTDQLLNLAEFVDINPYTYATLYPTDIKNTLDISSISKNRLLGTPDPNPLMPQSMGSKLDVYTAYLTAGTSIVLQNRTDTSTTIYQVPTQNGLTVYPLSSLTGYGFIQPVTQNYNFYKFAPVYSGNYINNIIDWNADQTLLNPTLSTFDEWYGDNGIIESTFRYLLTKNLFLK